MTAPITPDGRYVVVRGRLWRASNPNLAPETRAALVTDLMNARRMVKDALAAKHAGELVAARTRVQTAKEALGERGPVWWSDGAPDLNRRLIANTAYAEWWQAHLHAVSTTP